MIKILNLNYFSNLIVEGNTLMALRELEGLLAIFLESNPDENLSSYLTDITLLLVRLNRINRQNNRGIVSEDSFKIERQTIDNNVLSILKSLYANIKFLKFSNNPTIAQQIQELGNMPIIEGKKKNYVIYGLSCIIIILFLVLFTRNKPSIENTSRVQESEGGIAQTAGRDITNTTNNTILSHEYKKYGDKIEQIITDETGKVLGRIFNTYIKKGDSTFISIENSDGVSLYRNPVIPKIERAESSTSLNCNLEGVKYEDGGHYIEFYEKQGNFYKFRGHIDDRNVNYRIFGTAEKIKNKIILNGGEDGYLLLSKNCEFLDGEIHKDNYTFTIAK